MQMYEARKRDEFERLLLKVVEPSSYYFLKNEATEFNVEYSDKFTKALSFDFEEFNGMDSEDSIVHLQWAIMAFSEGPDDWKKVTGKEKRALMTMLSQANKAKAKGDKCYWRVS